VSAGRKLAATTITRGVGAGHPCRVAKARFCD
jgi:hypothetical protein